MNTTPYWTDSRDAPLRFPSLDEDLEVDVLVIGGGITGVSTAHLLVASGLKVALVERHRLGGGDTSHTTAHLTYMTDTRLSDLIRICGREETEVAWRAGEVAIRHIRKLSEVMPGNAEFSKVDGYLSMDREGDEEVVSELKDECQAALKMGFEVEYVDSIPPLRLPGIRFPGQAKFHPLRYLHGLAREISRSGGQIFENTDVAEFGSEGDRVTANGHQIRFTRVVIATHVPLQGNAGTVAAALFQTKLAAYSTYAVAALYPAGSLQEMIWSDTAEPFRYLRIDRTDRGDLAIFGGQDHKTGQEEDTDGQYRRLAELLETHLGNGEIIHRWSGQVIETVDGLPFIGEIVPDQFIATGFSGNGMTFGVVAALMARDWATGKISPWKDVFDPHRRKFRAAASYVSENSDFPVCMIKDRIQIGSSDEELSRGEGRVVRQGRDYVAQCRDASGALHECSAVCPHMGCIVAWNPAEKTWDCPCHGSRFAADGALIAGPAENPLEGCAGCRSC
jgi:glycine/D-amino acid oxidase-like deaminating enzyme/nitrite reductase/ring-hydroxylating ferredoxin subunit